MSTLTAVPARCPATTGSAVPAGTVRDHLNRLLEAGYRLESLAARTGWSRTALWRISRGITRRVRARTAAAILVVPIPDGVIYDGRSTHPAGTRRRLQALMRQGWSPSRIAAAAVVDRARLEAVLDDDGDQPIRRTLARAVGEVYDALWDQIPAMDEWWERKAAIDARTAAIENGWPPPAAWDDDEIDDPGARPAEEYAPGVITLPTSQDLDLEEWLHLVRGGEDHERAAHRCGATLEAVERAAYRHRHVAVLRHLQPTFLAAA